MRPHTPNSGYLCIVVLTGSCVFWASNLQFWFGPDIDFIDVYPGQTKIVLLNTDRNASGFGSGDGEVEQLLVTQETVPGLMRREPAVPCSVELK